MEIIDELLILKGEKWPVAITHYIPRWKSLQYISSMDATHNRLAVPRESDYWLHMLGIHAVYKTNTQVIG